MKEAILRRTSMGDAGTFGVLTVDGLSFHTGELPWRNNARGKSCVPAGEYLVRWMPSGKYGHKYQLQDVEGRDHILIHAANHVGDEDKGYKAQVDGCIALGSDIKQLDGQLAVRNSKNSVEAFEVHMDYQPFRLIIVDEYLEAGNLAEAPVA